MQVVERLNGCLARPCRGSFWPESSCLSRRRACRRLVAGPPRGVAGGCPSRDERVCIQAERRGVNKRTNDSRNVRRNSASNLACPRTPRAALAERQIEITRKPTDGDTDGVRTGWVARDGLVSFVPQVVPRPPVEQLGLLDLARGRRPESSILDCFSASPRTPVPPAVLRNTGAHCRLARMAGAWRQTRTVRCMVRVIHGFSSCHRVAQASMSRRISSGSLRSTIVCSSSMIAVRTRARGGGRGDGSRHATKGTGAPHGRLRVRSARSRDRRGDRLSHVRR